MRNPPITLQRSIFEPLHSQETEVHRQTKPLQAAVNLSPSSSSSSSSSSEKYFPEPHQSSPNMRRPPFFFHDHAAPAMHGGTHTPFFSKKAKSEHDLTSDFKYSSSGSSTGNGSSDDDDDDDGSVASKLLASITKSTSSPSLLASCKESSRETPYQKTLRLRRMKLQHCAEELGSESSDSSSCYGDQSIYDKLDISPFSCPPSVTFSEVHKKTEINPSSMITVQSASSLSGTPMTSNHSRYTRGRSFPPPLSHTLPAASSSECFSFSLRPYRENGHLVLKEVKVPCRQYLQANRKDGRLTLRVFTRDDEYRENIYSDHHHKAASKEYIQEREVQEEEHIDALPFCQRTANTIQEAEEVKSNTRHSQEVDSSNTVKSLDEEVYVVESEDIIDVGMDEFETSNAILHNCSFERVKCLANEGLFIATIEGNDDHVDDGKSVISNVVALRLKNSKFTIHKAQLLPTSKVSTNPPLSSSLTQQALMHPPGKSHGLPLSHDDISTFSQSNENFAWKGKLMQLSAAGKSLKRGYGGDASSPTIIFEEMNAKCLMEKVSNLAASFGLETGYRGKWCLGKMKSSLDGVGGINGGINDTNVGVCAIDEGNDFIDGGFNDINSGVNLDLSYGHDLRAFEGGTHVAWSLPSPFHFDLQIPSSTIQAALQGSEWLHTLHCKDLFFDRNQLGKGFMKLHSVATRS